MRINVKLTPQVMLSNVTMFKNLKNDHLIINIQIFKGSSLKEIIVLRI